MSYDLIIVSKSTDKVIPVTQRCIDSALAECPCYVILIETGQPYKYSGVNKFIEYNGQFNYNRALNLGLKYAKSDIHILANNDLIFQKGWSRIGEYMKANDVHSASAVTGDRFQAGMIYEGYQVGKVLLGWCIFLDDFVLQKIGKLDESVSFWYSDNLYGAQLKVAGIKHVLFTDFRVDHLGSFTLRQLSNRIQRHLALDERHIYNERQRYYDKRNG